MPTVEFCAVAICASTHLAQWPLFSYRRTCSFIISLIRVVIRPSCTQLGLAPSAWRGDANADLHLVILGTGISRAASPRLVPGWVGGKPHDPGTVFYHGTPSQDFPMAPTLRVFLRHVLPTDAAGIHRH